MLLDLLMKATSKQEAVICLKLQSVYFWADLLPPICRGDGGYIDKDRQNKGGFCWEIQIVALFKYLIKWHINVSSLFSSKSLVA